MSKGLGRAFAALTLSLLTAGCLTNNNGSNNNGSDADTNDTEITISTTNISADGVSRKAVCVGWLNIESGDAACPGTDVDAKTVFGWCTNMQSRTKLMNSGATIAKLKAAITEANKGMKPDDFLLLSVSGHGTYRTDVSGDEANGKDEGIVAWDDVWWDDDIWSFICGLNPCRLLMISDTCHSEGHWRAMIRTLSFNTVFKPSYVVLDLGLDAGRRSEWPGQLLQLAGCREESYSYGAEAGGTWTQTLDAKRSVATSWTNLFVAARAVMPAEQEPVWTSYNASDNFVRGWDLK